MVRQVGIEYPADGGIQFDYGMQSMRISLKGPTGFDSETNWNVSMPSAGLQLVNLIFHTF